MIQRRLALCPPFGRGVDRRLALSLPGDLTPGFGDPEAESPARNDGAGPRSVRRADEIKSTTETRGARRLCFPVVPPWRIFVSLHSDARIFVGSEIWARREEG